MIPAEGAAARRARRGLIAAVAGVGLAQVALASRSSGVLPEYWVAVAMGWACAASLWDFEEGEPASRGWIAAGAALVAASLLELAPEPYRTAHRVAPLAGGVGLALLEGPRELRRQVRALAMLLCPVLLPAPRLARALLDLAPLTAVTASAALKLVGVPVVRAGVELHLPRSTLLVAEGCSGLSQILALLLMALFAVSLFPTGRVQKLWIFGSAACIGFVCNTVRIAALTLLADRGEMGLFAAWHTGALSPLCTVAAVAVALAVWFPLLRPAACEAHAPGRPV